MIASSSAAASRLTSIPSSSSWSTSQPRSASAASRRPMLDRRDEQRRRAALEARGEEVRHGLRKLRQLAIDLDGVAALAPARDKIVPRAQWVRSRRRPSRCLRSWVSSVEPTLTAPESSGVRRELPGLDGVERKLPIRPEPRHADADQPQRAGPVTQAAVEQAARKLG